MEGFAPASALIAGPRVRAADDRAGLAFSVATAADDAEVRRLLRETPIPGTIALSFEREPDSSIAAAVEGDSHHTMLARDAATRELAAIACRSVRQRFVNGQSRRVGYLGQLRITPAFRRRRSLLTDGFAFCASLQRSDPCALHLASLVADNHAARRLLERGRPGWPLFTELDRLSTLVLAVRGPRRSRLEGVRFVSGDYVGAPALAAFLHDYNRRYQFAPCWNAEDLRRTPPGPALSDFIVALRAGAIAGCAALWDQRAFKQVVVRGYAPVLRWLRPLVNVTAPLTGAPRLPAVGRRVELATLSHVAVLGDDPELAVAIVAETGRRAGAKGLDHVVLGLSARGPLLGPLKRAFAHRAYETILYGVAWPGDDDVSVDVARPSQPEIAIL